VTGARLVGIHTHTILDNDGWPTGFLQPTATGGLVVAVSGRSGWSLGALSLPNGPLFVASSLDDGEVTCGCELLARGGELQRLSKKEAQMHELELEK